MAAGRHTQSQTHRRPWPARLGRIDRYRGFVESAPDTTRDRVVEMVLESGDQIAGRFANALGIDGDFSDLGPDGPWDTPHMLFAIRSFGVDGSDIELVTEGYEDFLDAAGQLRPGVEAGVVSAEAVEAFYDADTGDTQEALRIAAASGTCWDSDGLLLVTEAWGHSADAMKQVAAAPDPDKARQVLQALGPPSEAPDRVEQRLYTVVLRDGSGGMRVDVSGDVEHPGAGVNTTHAPQGRTSLGAEASDYRLAGPIPDALWATLGVDPPAPDGDPYPAMDPSTVDSMQRRVWYQYILTRAALEGTGSSKFAPIEHLVERIPLGAFATILGLDPDMPLAEAADACSVGGGCGQEARALLELASQYPDDATRALQRALSVHLQLMEVVSGLADEFQVEASPAMAAAQWTHYSSLMQSIEAALWPSVARVFMEVGAGVVVDEPEAFLGSGNPVALLVEQGWPRETIIAALVDHAEGSAEESSLLDGWSPEPSLPSTLAYAAMASCEGLADELPADELPADELPADELPAEGPWSGFSLTTDGHLQRIGANMDNFRRYLPDWMRMCSDSAPQRTLAVLLSKAGYDLEELCSMSACGYSLDVDQRRFHIGRRDADTCGQRARHYRTMLRSIRDQKRDLMGGQFAEELLTTIAEVQSSIFGGAYSGSREQVEAWFTKQLDATDANLEFLDRWESSLVELDGPSLVVFRSPNGRWDVAERPGRNDSCPCYEGQVRGVKFKRCHGALPLDNGKETP
ncbi:MAG: SEC-C domain-containing protein [Actinomycetia bacterium]|nr:SEC-C domain-containing protein [Actinomycetes bacterium]